MIPHLTAALAGRQLLSHPFYQRWSQGELSRDDLRAYAEQYRYFEAALPTMLSGIHHRIDDIPTRRTVSRHLADEEGGERSHLELFDDYAASLGATASAPTAATVALLDTYGSLVARGPAAGMAALYAYESQAAAIATTKAAGLRRWYGLDDAAIAFWDAHAHIDEHHGEWTLEALIALSESTPETVAAASAAADAWWGLLSEREAAHVAAHAVS